MAKRGRKKKFKVSFNISPETLRSIFAVLLLLFSVISLISFFAPTYTLNAQLQIVFRKAFGVSSFLLPFITVSVGLLFIDSFKHRVKELRVIIGLIVLQFTLSGFFHIFIDPSEAKQKALAGFGGGFVGFALSFGLSNLISIYGGIAVLLALLVLAVILIFDLSIDSALEFLKSKMPSKLFKAREKDKIEVTTGMDEKSSKEDSLPASKKLSKPELSTKPPVEEESFEIIPSMAEPQAKVILDPSEALAGEVPSLSPNLPYPDKVWQLPSIDLLSTAPDEKPETEDVEKSKKEIKDTLASFKIPVTIADTQIGPTVTKFALDTPPGVKIAKIANLQYDLALALASPTGSVRIEAPIPGKALVGIEVPNKKRAFVSFKSLITSDAIKSSKSKLDIVLGKDVGGVTHVYNIAKMPHLLIAGATGSGKSVFIHNLIFSILFKATPQEVKFIMVDPKRVELAPYHDIPHLYTPIVTDIEKSPAVFKWAVTEMSRRYKMFESAKARNIEAYNEKSGFQALPYIVIIVDELAEIMVADPSSVEKSIIRIAQLARATGIHLVLAAQRPSANVITGLIKANIPCRVAFNVTGQVDSRVIIDQTGAEKLLGQGDMLFVPPDKPTPVRLQSAFLSDAEISSVLNYIRSQGVPPEYKDEILETPVDSKSGDRSVAAGGDTVDSYYDEAIETVVSAGKASASLLQRRLSIGYARAARILDELEQNGIIGSSQGSRPREVLVDSVALEDEPTIPDIKTPRINLDR